MKPILASVTILGVPWSAKATVRLHSTDPEPSVDYMSEFRVYLYGRVLAARVPVPDDVIEALRGDAIGTFLEMTVAELRDCTEARDG
jgi:hypothetical protein